MLWCTGEEKMALRCLKKAFLFLTWPNLMQDICTIIYLLESCLRQLLSLENTEHA